MQWVFIIVGCLGLIYLYLLFIQWLFMAIGPGFLLFASVLFSFSVPIVYMRSLLKVFARDEGDPRLLRNSLFVPTIALVLLIHLDLLWLSLNMGVSLLNVSWGYDLQWLLTGVVREAYGNRSALAIANVLLPDQTSMELQVLVSAVAKSVLILPIVLLVRGLSSTVQDPRQPALLSYFHGQAGKDLRAVLGDMTEDLMGLAKWTHRSIVKVGSSGAWSVLIWPLLLMAYLSLLPPVLIAILARLMFLVMHSLSLGLIRLVAMAVSGILSLIERAVIRSRAGYAKCPHSSCHEPVPLPVFLCPTCSEKHDRLIPGRFGVFLRTCNCGTRLPTLSWLGRGRLKSLCPHCQKEMSEELFGGSVHVPIYGGPNTGKTSFMMAAAWQLLEGKLSGLHAHLIDEWSNRDYTTSWKPNFESGAAPGKTTNRFPEAFLLSMRRGRGLPVSVYLYDPAGEAFQSEEALRAHGFMNYFDGLALLIDPLSLPSFKDRYREGTGPDLSPTTSDMHPEETLTRVVNLLEGLGKLSRSKGASERVAVIFTKADVPGFAKELGINIDHGKAVQEDWTGLGKDDAARIRDWLARNEPHLLQLLETRFKEIRFFAVSALGHIPHPGVGFQPRGVLEPLAWLLSTRTTFSRPLLSKVMGRVMEAGAVLAVVSTLVLLSAWAAYRSQDYWPQVQAALKQAVQEPRLADPLQSWRDLAAKEDPEGLYQVGQATVAVYPEEALPMLRLAAQKGHRQAMAYLARRAMARTLEPPPTQEEAAAEVQSEPTAPMPPRAEEESVSKTTPKTTDESAPK